MRVNCFQDEKMTAMNAASRPSPVRITIPNAMMRAPAHVEHPGGLDERHEADPGEETRGIGEPGTPEDHAEHQHNEEHHNGIQYEA